MPNNEPMEGISIVITGNIVSLQHARRLSKKEKTNHDKSKNFKVQEISISFNPEAWLEELPKTLHKRVYYR